MTRRPLKITPQRDLFGMPAATPKDATPVSVALRELEGSSTDKALFLVPLTGGRGKPGFAPRSEVRHDARSGLYSMPKWLAAERGWL